MPKFDEKTQRAFAIVGGVLSSNAVVLQFLDLNNSGLDDKLAKVLRLSGQGFTNAARGISGTGDSLRLAAQTLIDIADEIDGKQPIEG